MSKPSQKTRFNKLTLKKNKDGQLQKSNRSSDLIIIDESFDQLRSDFAQNVHSAVKIYSPIVINDSSELSLEAEQSKRNLTDRIPSKSGNVSHNSSQNDSSILGVKEQCPSIGGWSPAQGIIFATPRHKTIPSTPRDVANESQEVCSIKKIQYSQKKLLDELYGEVWKTIPTLFKAAKLKKDEEMDGVTKKLQFNDEDSDSDINTYRKQLKRNIAVNRELYLTGSAAKNKFDTHNNTEKKCKKKLYTEKIPNTPDPNILRPRVRKDANTSKKIKGLSVTELVDVMKDKYFNNEHGDVVVDKDKENINGTDYLTNQKNIIPDNDEKYPKTKPVTSKEASSLPYKNNKHGDVLVTKDKDNYNGTDSLTNKQNIIIPDKDKKYPKTKPVTSKEVKKKTASSLPDKNKSVKDKRVQSVLDKYYQYKDISDNEIDSLVKKVDKVCVTPNKENGIQRLSFVGSLAENIPSWRLHPESIKYKDNYKSLKEELARRLFVEFNKNIFEGGLDADMIVAWDTKLRTTAGTTTNRHVRTSKGEHFRSSSIKLSVKVIDNPERLRDTLVHEMCHAATWCIDHVIRAGHGPVWVRWARRALSVYPELGEISRCHDMQIHYKYSYKCTKCGYAIQRHSKSVDITKKCCGYCLGTFQLIINKKNKDGVVVSTPARQGEVNEFAKYVKENYGALKKGKTHAEVMKTLGEQFSAKKNKVRVS